MWHTYDWQDALSTWQWQDISFAICDSDDLLAIVPLHLIRGKLFRVIDYNQLNSFGSPALKNGLGRKQIAKLKEFNAGEPLGTDERQLHKGYNMEPVDQQIQALEKKKAEAQAKIDALLDEARKKGIEPGQLR